MSSRKSTPLKQLTLNFGQKPSKTVHCSECCITYDQNDKEDSQLHAKIHNEKDIVLKYSTLKGEKTVQEYSDGKCIVIETGIDSKQLVNKAIQILDYVDNQLGIGSNKNNEIATKLKESTKIYLFYSNSCKKIVGVCIAEPIDKAYKIEYLNTDGCTFTMNESKCEKAICGINRIWVASHMRRQRVASRLLDCVRINFLYFRSLNLNELAFSDPTEFGRSLAKNYFQTESFLIYNHKN